MHFLYNILLLFVCGLYKGEKKTTGERKRGKKKKTTRAKDGRKQELKKNNDKKKKKGKTLRFDFDF